jgi:hypothetical protein
VVVTGIIDLKVLTESGYLFRVLTSLWSSEECFGSFFTFDDSILVPRTLG